MARELADDLRDVGVRDGRDAVSSLLRAAMPMLRGRQPRRWIESLAVAVESLDEADPLARSLALVIEGRDVDAFADEALAAALDCRGVEARAAIGVLIAAIAQVVDDILSERSLIR